MSNARCGAGGRALDERPYGVERKMVRNSRRDVGIAPCAKFWLGRNIYPHCVGRGALTPPLLAASILLQAILERALRREDSFSHGLWPCQLPQRGSQGRCGAVEIVLYKAQKKQLPLARELLCGEIYSSGVVAGAASSRELMSNMGRVVSPVMKVGRAPFQRSA